MKKLLFIISLLLLQVKCYSRQSEEYANNKRVPLSGLVKELVSADTTPVMLEGVDFYGDGDLYRYVLDNFPNARLSKDSLILVNRQVVLTNCRFEFFVQFEKFRFRKEVSLTIAATLPEGMGDIAMFTISNSIFDDNLKLHFSGKPYFIFNLDASWVHGDFSLSQEDGYLGMTGITKCNFSPTPEDTHILTSDLGKINVQRSHFSISNNNVVFEFSDNNLYFQFKNKSGNAAWLDGRIASKASSVVIGGNQIKSNIDSVHANDSLFFLSVFEIKLDQGAKAALLTKNDFKVPVALSLGLTLDALKIYENKFSDIGFDAFKIPDEENTIYWSDISGRNAGIRSGDYGRSKIGFYKANTEKQLSNLLTYKDLIKFYKKFYDAYKANGDIKSSNQVFVEIKDLETRRLKYEYKTNPDFNTFFQIKLNQLLKFYTTFGTDPARALIISIWLLFIFAVFYFFFPSTWDVTSKSRLINDFKLFIEKNEHGYFKPFLRLLLGFSISLLNALTLSLNSFVTLGFGEIPTTGIARYVTILQGFIGWFLLSLFTVALLNQVIF